MPVCHLDDFGHHFYTLDPMARTRRNWTPAEDALLRTAVKNGMPF